MFHGNRQVPLSLHFVWLARYISLAIAYYKGNTASSVRRHLGVVLDEVSERPAAVGRAAGVGTKSPSVEVCGGREWVTDRVPVLSSHCELVWKSKEGLDARRSGVGRRVCPWKWSTRALGAPVEWCRTACLSVEMDIARALGAPVEWCRTAVLSVEMVHAGSRSSGGQWSVRRSF